MMPTSTLPRIFFSFFPSVKFHLCRINLVNHRFIFFLWRKNRRSHRRLFNHLFFFFIIFFNSRGCCKVDLVISWCFVWSGVVLVLYVMLILWNILRLNHSFLKDGRFNHVLKGKPCCSFHLKVLIGQEK